jgi:hypothetical protein
VTRGFLCGNGITDHAADEHGKSEGRN